MKTTHFISLEDERLVEFVINNTEPNAVFEDVVTFAANSLCAGFAAVSFLDEDRQWLKAKVGFRISETERDRLLCHHVIERNEPLIIDDITKNQGEHVSPLLEKHDIRFYASFPVRAPNGSVVGTLCVLDHKPRQLNNSEQGLLEFLAKQLSTELTSLMNRQLSYQKHAQSARSEQLLASITQAHERFIMGAAYKDIANDLLKELLSLTESEYGFFGEVMRTDAGDLFLKTHAITNIAWNKATREFHDTHVNDGLEFYNLKTLFGLVMTSKQPVISNDPYHDPRRGGLPPGHPTMNCFLGIPIFQQGQLIGMAGLANRPSGYSPKLIDFLQPFMSACANLMIAQRLSLETKIANKALKESEARFRHTFESASDGIIMIDQSGRILNFNAAASQMFRYDIDNIVGKNISLLMPSPHAEQHDEYLRRSTLPEMGRVFGAARELQGQRSDGTTFPIEIAVNHILTPQGKGYSGIIRDLSERKKIERMKDEFTATISHELRTPLTSIRGSLKLLASGAMGDLNRDVIDLVDTSLRNTDALSFLINDLLDLEKITSGILDFEFRTHLVSDIIQEAISSTKGFASQLGIQIETNIQCPKAAVRTDNDRLQQVLRNLISNACKFSHEAGTVNIGARLLDDSQLEISVEDHGIGIPDSFKPLIFQRFTQADGSNTRKIGGSGLGLSIAKQLTERMGGSLTFESEVERGTTFFLTFPLKIQGS